MKQRLVQSLAPFAAAAVGLAALCGCEKKPAEKKTDEKKPEVYMVRGEDPAYQKVLLETRARQNRHAAARARVVPRMEALVARARAALPEGATEDAVRAELEAHPEKYLGWTELSAALTNANAQLEREMARARATVRARILKEAADRTAVKEGRATAKKTPAAK